MIEITTKGSFNGVERYLNKLKSGEMFRILDKYGAQGVAALAAATPTESGQTAASWDYTVVNRPGYSSIRWSNTNTVDGRPLAILLQYGHGTGTGGYVPGRDYINPAIRPVFEQILAEIDREVKSLG